MNGAGRGDEADAVELLVGNPKAGIGRQNTGWLHSRGQRRRTLAKTSTGDNLNGTGHQIKGRSLGHDQRDRAENRREERADSGPSHGRHNSVTE